MGTRTAVITLAATVLLVAGVTLSVGAGTLRSSHQTPAETCDRTVPLIPRSRGGLPWQRHRHWLAPIDGDRLPGQSHVVRNERTGEWFRWHRTPDDAGEPRFMVPTRYALFGNRRWQGDPWSYCLVLTPQPPYRLSAGGFETRSHARPVAIDAETPVTITAAVSARTAASVIVVIELRDERGTRMLQWSLDGEVFDKDQMKRYDLTWQPPAGTEPGIYVIEVGIFAAGSGRLLHWNDGTGVLLLRGPSPLTEP